MFIIVQFPLADLRPLVPGGRGRLAKPDWRTPGLTSGFIRGFGKVSERNRSGLGLEGEGYFADFDHALKFPRMIDVRDADWNGRLHANVWFRRLYYDGRIAGRFEIAFNCHDAEEVVLTTGRPETGLEAITFDLSRIVSVVENAPVEVVSPDSSVWRGRLATCAKPLGLAYIAATTSREARDVDVVDVYGHEVVVGAPRVHVRIPSARRIVRSRDEQPISSLAGSETYIISSQGNANRKTVIVQQTPFPSRSESPKERAVRVLFANIFALSFAIGHFAKEREVIFEGARRPVLREIVQDLIERLGTYAPRDSEDDDQRHFDAELRTFSTVYAGRIDELTNELEAISRDWNKPSIGERAAALAAKLLELVVKTSVEKGIDLASGKA